MYLSNRVLIEYLLKVMDDKIVCDFNETQLTFINSTLLSTSLLRLTVREHDQPTSHHLSYHHFKINKMFVQANKMFAEREVRCCLFKICTKDIFFHGLKRHNNHSDQYCFMG